MKFASITRRAPLAGMSALALLTLSVGCASGGPEGSSVELEASDPGQLIAAGAQVYGNNCARCHNARAAAEKTDLEWDLVVAHMRARANLTGSQARAVQAFLAMVNTPSGGGGGEASDETKETDVRTDENPHPEAGRFDQNVTDPKTIGGPFSYDELSPFLPEEGAVHPQDLQEDSIGKGRSLATAKGCIGCHVLEGKGGTIGPSLDDLFERRKEEFVREKLINPSTDNPNSVMPDYGLSAEEVSTFMAYLRSLGKKIQGAPGSG